MMSGACLKSGSMSKYSPVLISSNSKHTIQQQKAFHVGIFESKCSHVFRCVFGFEKTIDVFESIIVLTNTQSHRRALPILHLDSDCGTMLHCVCLSGSLLTLHGSGSQNQIARCWKRLAFRTCSWSFCQLCLRHTSDDPPRDVWSKWVSVLFLGNVLCWCRSVSTSMVSVCSTNLPTSWLRQAPSQLREVALQRTIEKRVEIAESYLASSVCILLHTTSIEFSCVSDPQTCLCPPKSSLTVDARIFALLHWNNLVDTCGMYPINLFPSRSQHKIFGQIPSVDIIPEYSSSFQDLIILKRDFWYWACNFLNCIQLIILFELFTKRLQNHRNQFWRIRVQQRCLHLRVHPVSLPNFPGHAQQSSFFKFSNCLWRNLLFSERIHSILIASSEHSICIQVLSRSKWLILLWISSS